MGISEGCRAAIESKRCRADCCGCVIIHKDIYLKNKDRIQDKVIEIVEAAEEIIPVTESGFCCFLTEDKRCAIYESRPYACRVYGTGIEEDLMCAFVKPNGHPRSPAMVKRMQRKINHYVDDGLRKLSRRVER